MTPLRISLSDLPAPIERVGQLEPDPTGIGASAAPDLRILYDRHLTVRAISHVADSLLRKSSRRRSGWRDKSHTGNDMVDLLDEFSIVRLVARFAN